MRLGQAGVGLKELIATLVVSAILIIVGIYVFAKVKGSMATDLTGNASSAVATVEKTAYDAFTLATVALIVLSAAVIIGILIRAFGA
jgi:hypothetical protein